MSASNRAGGVTTLRIVRGFGATAYNQTVIIAVQLAMVPLLVGHWGVSLYGVWVLISSIPTYLALSDFGFATAAGTDMTIKVARGDHDGATVTFQSAWLSILICSGMVGAVGFVSCWFLPDRILRVPTIMGADDVRKTLTAFVLYGLLCLNSTVFMAALRSDGGFATAMAASASMYLCEGITTASMVLIGGSPVEVAYVYPFTRLIGIIILIFTVKSRIRWLRLGIFEAKSTEIRRLIGPATAAMALPISQALILQGTALAVGASASPAQVAIFTTVRTLTRVGTQLGTLFNQPLIPEFSAAFARKQHEKEKTILLFLYMTNGLVLLSMTFFISTMGANVIRLWTRGTIHPTAGLILTMTAAMMINGLWSPAASVLMAMNYQRLYTYIYMWLSAITVAGAFFFSRKYGALGAALAILAQETFMCAFVQGLISRIVATPIELMRSTGSTCREVGRRIRSATFKN